MFSNGITYVCCAGERPKGPSRQSPAKCEETIFQLFDVNGDGRISLSEFLLVLTLLSIPEEDASIIFRQGGG